VKLCIAQMLQVLMKVSGQSVCLPVLHWFLGGDLPAVLSGRLETACTRLCSAKQHWSWQILLPQASPICRCSLQRWSACPTSLPTPR